MILHMAPNRWSNISSSTSSPGVAYHHRPRKSVPGCIWPLIPIRGRSPCAPCPTPGFRWRSGFLPGEGQRVSFWFSFRFFVINLYLLLYLLYNFIFVFFLVFLWPPPPQGGPSTDGWVGGCSAQLKRPALHPGRPVVSLLPDGDTPPTFCFTQQATQSAGRGPTQPISFEGVFMSLHFSGDLKSPVRFWNLPSQSLVMPNQASSSIIRWDCRSLKLQMFSCGVPMYLGAERVWTKRTFKHENTIPFLMVLIKLFSLFCLQLDLLRLEQILGMTALGGTKRSQQNFI